MDFTECLQYKNHRGGGQHRVLRVCLQSAGTRGVPHRAGFPPLDREEISATIRRRGHRGFRPAPTGRQRYRLAALDAQGGQDAALCHHDRLCRSAYGGGKHEARLAGLHTQAACGGQARPPAAEHIERTAHQTEPYACVLT